MLKSAAALALLAAAWAVRTWADAHARYERAQAEREAGQDRGRP